MSRYTRWRGEGKGSTVVGSGGILADPGDGCEQRLVAGSEVDEQGAGSMEQELR